MHLTGQLIFPLYLLVYVILQIATGSGQKLHRMHNGRLVKEPPGTVLFQLASMTMWLVGVITYEFFPLNDWVPLRIGGIGLVVIGLYLSIWSKITLGNKAWIGGIGAYKNHALKTSGPYRIVRHPLYLGILVSSIGAGIASINPFVLLAGLFWGTAFLWRMPLEEAAMRTKFSRSYPAYERRTGRILPKISR